jgi:MSHA biogenesis protein MshP
MKTPHTRQRGFAAISAVFLLVVLAALGAFMLTFSNTQQLTSAQDVQGSRAYWAARGGLEWGIASTVAAAACPASPTVLALNGFAVTVTCASAVFVEGGSPRTIYQFTSMATLGAVPGTISYIERSVSASREQ